MAGGDITRFPEPGPAGNRHSPVVARPRPRFLSTYIRPASRGSSMITSPEIRLGHLPLFPLAGVVLR